MGFMFVEHLNEVESKRIRLDSVLDSNHLTPFVHFQSRYEKTVRVKPPDVHQLQVPAKVERQTQ